LESCRAQIDASHQTALRWRWALVAAIAVLVGAAFAYEASRKKAAPLAPLPEKSIAVLPFENLSKDETMQPSLSVFRMSYYPTSHASLT
jgi:hypothetical protein